MSEKERTLEIKIVATNDESMDQLLNMAIEDLEALRTPAFRTGTRKTVKKAGDIGDYLVTYGEGSEALYEICESLRQEGYKEDIKQGLGTNYVDFVHESKPTMRIYCDSLSVEEVDQQDSDPFL